MEPKNMTPKSGVKRSLGAKGWVPGQKGSWGIALLPLLLGCWLAGWHPLFALLIPAWFSAFAFFQVFEKWMKAPSSRRSSLQPAFATWTGLTALLGIPLLVVAPRLLAWAPFFAPLVALALWGVSRGHDRAIATRFSSVLASTLMTPVAASLSLDVYPTNTELGFAWVSFGVLSAYFIACVPYVRSLIRGRKNPRPWIIAGGVLHLLALVGVCCAVWANLLGWSSIVLWVALLARSLIVPLWQARRAKPIPVIVLGRSEIVWSLLVIASLTIPLI